MWSLVKSTINFDVFRPDVFFFQDSQQQYENSLKILSRSRFLYTNGKNIKPASIFRFAFETFKGWLGFSNGCEEKKIRMSLYKFAYYGYLKDYPRNAFLEFKKYPLDEYFIGALVTKRDDQKTETIQDFLIQYYRQMVYPLRNSPNYHLPVSYAFGESWIALKQSHELLKIDPQNPNLLERAVKNLLEVPFTKIIDFVQDSKLSIALAQEYLKKAKSQINPGIAGWFINHLFKGMTVDDLVSMAEKLAPTLIKQEAIFFFNYHFRHKDYQKAFNIDEMSLVNNLKKIFAETLKNEHLGSISPFIKKDTRLAKKLCRMYLNGNFENISIIQNAKLLLSNFDKLYPDSAFFLYINDDKYEEAYRIYESASDLKYNPAYLRAAELYFSKQSDDEYEKVKKYHSDQKLKDARNACLNSLELLKKALKVSFSESSMEEIFYSRKRHYAQLLVEIDSLNPITSCNMEEISKAINLLEQCNPTAKLERKQLKIARAQALMRRIDFKVHQITPTSLVTRLSLRAHVEKNKEDIQLTLNWLKNLVDFIEPTDDKCLKPLLGKAYFLMADINHQFLDLNYNHYYKKAMEIVGDNPFYILRCSEVFPDERVELQTKGVPLLKERGFEVKEYTEWFDERWHSDKISTIQDIHDFNSEASLIEQHRSAAYTRKLW